MAPQRRLWVLLGLNGVLAIVLGFRAFTADESMRLVIYGGYWAMLVFAILFAISLVKLARDTPFDWRLWRNRPLWPAMLVAACAIVLLVHERYGFKILMDEAMLLGTSMTMHLEKTALVPMRGNDIHGAFQILNGQLDKRPLFQPFLTSVLHDFTGYRPENAFVLNTILAFVFLGLAFHVGRRVAGMAGGVLTVLLLTGLPLLAQNATGGGFELLNLVMILSTLALGMRFAVRRDANSQWAFVLSGVLLAHTRYESILFLIPVVLLVAWVWWQRREPVISMGILWAPLLLVPYALHHAVFRSRESSWELASRPGYDRPFSIGYVPENLDHALNFFFSTTGEHSNSLAIAALGFIALPFFVLWWVKIVRAARSADSNRLALAVFALGFAAHTALLMCYFWGKFDDPVIRRLSLPLNLGLVLAIVTMTAELGGRRALQSLCVVSVMALLIHSLPAMSRHDYTQDYYVGREGDWKREFIAQHPEKDYLFIDLNAIFWLVHQVSATPQPQAIQRKEDVLFHFRNRTFSAMYVFQRFNVDTNTGALTIEHDDDVGPDYELETVLERRFTLLRLSRISRVVKIAEGPASAVPPALPSAKPLTPAERETVRKAYFENFFRRLP
ncbi:MAG: hypothetical protein Q7S40_03960 [Opitutaceae bacterium]|nr:hypothetical protein [Opitutaceae bacterium]